MLTRRVLQSLLGLILLGGMVVVTAAPASADYIYCPPDHGACIIVVTGGGGGGGGGGGSGSGAAQCLHDQLGTVPCFRASMGWFNPTDACYWRRLDLASGDPLWGGNNPANGFVYAVYCYWGLSAGWVIERYQYRTSSPPGYGGLPTPLSLAVQAINRLPITGPTINLAPSPSGSGLVGLPVWMWNSVTSRTWGPISATASVPGLSVTATARASYIDWNMGDGTTVRCTRAGTAYRTSFGDRASPDCGHRYRQPSRTRSGGRYTITATTRWNVTWSGGGRSGTVTVTRTSTSSLRINELQVVIE